MIKNEEILTYRDAYNWAKEISDFNDNQLSLVADYIWENRPILRDIGFTRKEWIKENPAFKDNFCFSDVANGNLNRVKLVNDYEDAKKNLKESEKAYDNALALVLDSLWEIVRK